MNLGSVRHVKWYRSLAFIGVLGVILVPLWDMGGIFLIMNSRGRDAVLKESSRLMEEVGNNVVSNLGERSQQVEALCRSLANAAENMPRDPGLVMKVFPGMIHFHGDLAVAGGGIWPEPGAFTPGVVRRSFFWGRDKDGALAFFDDYNHGRGYHNDEWYPVVRYSKPGRCFWSRSYMDPYSYQPMVTCTVAMHDAGRFSGVTTIDLKLEGLTQFMDDWKKRTGGYIFLLDRNNKFLTFPKRELVVNVGKDDKGNRTEEFLLAADLGKKEPLFQPIADAVEEMNKQILLRALSMPGYNPDLIKKIDADSDQIDQTEAAFVTAVIADPLGATMTTTNLFQDFVVKKDFITNEESIVYIFHVPDSYWKVVVVKPLSEAAAVASRITRDLLLMAGITILIGIIPAGILSHMVLTRPVKRTIEAVEGLGQLVSENRYDQLENHQISTRRDDELGQLARVVNSMASQLQTSYGALVDLNSSLERKVEERTKMLENTLGEVNELKVQQDGDYFLTSLLLRPLSALRSHSNRVCVEALVEQKKHFSFRNRSDEIGGDFVIADSLELRGRHHVFFLNGDAMGKSMQGAGGALVLGAVMNGILERSKLVAAARDIHPERWLKNTYVELQKVFETFDGSMLVSVVMGLIDEESGLLYYINAEHPWSVILRGEKASFIESEHMYRKLGSPVYDADAGIATFQLEQGDVLFAGSDGRDDLFLRFDTNGERILNEDETLFLRAVEASGGDLKALREQITLVGQLTDDLSLLRIGYVGAPEGAQFTPESQLLHAEGMRLISVGADADGLSKLEEALEVDSSNPKIVLDLAKLALRAGRYETAAGLFERLCDIEPGVTKSAYLASYAFRKAGQMEKAIDYGERVYLRDPHMVKNLVNLAALHARRGNLFRATMMIQKAGAIDSQNPKVAQLQSQIMAMSNR